MQVAQTDEGLIPEIAPEFTKFGEPFRDSPEWGSNAVILPWYLYQWYGDKSVLTDNFTTMQRYLKYLEGKADKGILKQGLGDWYDIGPKSPGLSQNTLQGLTATAIYRYDLQIAEKVARLLGKSADATRYQKLAVEVKQSFNNSFFNEGTKQYGSGSQTANAMAIYCGLVDPKYKTAVVENIVQDLRSRNNSLTAGDIGYRYLLRVLDDEGRSDVIYAMNNRSDVPGYGYQLDKGATALTESWQALAGVSNNHLMLGHLMEWFYSGLAGIRQANNSVAFRNIEIRPEPVGDITHAEAQTYSPYGIISSKWLREGSKFTLDIEIPANSDAIVYLPVSKTAKLVVNGKVTAGNVSTEGKVIIRVGSGKYHITAN
jgi:hypothetical protein